MGYISPELPAMAEINETSTITSLDFSCLEVGDQVALYFYDGRAYWLTVDNQDEQGNIFGKALAARKSQFAKEIESWEPLPHSLLFCGSCQRLGVDQHEVFVLGAEQGSFEVGRGAWFRFTSEERGEREFVTQPVAEIKYLAASDGGAINE